MRDPIQQFSEALASRGLIVPASIVADGSFQRADVEGRNGKGDGSYILHLDGIPAGSICNWKDGLGWQAWRADIGRTLTDAEKQALRQRAERDRVQREKAAERKREWAKARASELLALTVPAPADHPYIVAKQIQPHALRLFTGQLEIGEMDCAGALVVKLVNRDREVAAVQFISADGKKRYLGPVEGCYYPIGKPDDEQPVLICEGAATGHSLHEATGYAVAVALDAGNLPRVARLMRERFPSHRIVVCADDDWRTAWPDGSPRNTGMDAANATAAEVGGFVAAPTFGHDRPEWATDFNDLLKLRGAAAVQEAVHAAQPPRVPEDQPPPGNASTAPLEISGKRIELVRADSITPEAVSWLWHGYLARGKVHIMAGAPSTGKTTLATGLIATVTCGGRWPDGSQAAPGSALIWSGEDSPADTLVPRLIAAGADLTKVRFVGSVTDGSGPRPFDPAQDFFALQASAAEIPDLAIVLVDPIVSAIAGDGHKGNDVRRGLQPLVNFAHQLGCAVLGISHFSKGTAGRDPVERVTGSIAFGALARVVLATAKLPEADGGGRILVRAKSNLGPDGGGFRYGIAPVEIIGGIQTTRPEWLAPLEGEARELLAAAESDDDAETRSELDDAAAFLRDMLKDGPRGVKEVEAEARGAGHSDATLRRARRTIGVEAYKAGMKEGWKLRLPPSEPPKALMKPEGAQLSGVSVFAESEHLRRVSADVEEF